MTNGEKLQETFKVYVREVGEGMTRFYIAGIMYLTSTEWWNAEYKELVIRDNGVKNELNLVKDELGVASELEKDFGELDCISRADAIKAMQDTAKKLTNEDTINGLCGAVAILFDLPSVTSQRTKGHWITTHNYLIGAVKCSCCHEDSLEEGNYCSNCGAKMEGVENDNSREE